MAKASCEIQPPVHNVGVNERFNRKKRFSYAEEFKQYLKEHAQAMEKLGAAPKSNLLGK